MGRIASGYVPLWIGFICFRAYADHRQTDQLQSCQDFMFRERPVRSDFGVVDSSGLLYFDLVEHFQTFEVL